MRSNEYTSIDILKSILFTPSEIVTPKTIEKILLFLIAFLGILGSLYVFTANSSSNNSPNYNNISFIAAPASDLDNADLVGKVKFKNFFKIEGKKKVGQTLNFTFLEDRKATRYVLDMGNGERVIITSNEFPYTFHKPGKYLMELKTINRGLISTIASKQIKIK